jgi:ATP/maltotriose-dependent transcriptional regulator MalT
MTFSIARARAAFARQAWGEAFETFSAADEEASLEAADHERRAACAYLLGEDEACREAWEAAHQVALEAGDAPDAARCAFWLALCLMLRGQMAQAGGWLARAEGLVDDSAPRCAASGYLLIPRLLGALEAGDPATARDLAVQTTDLGIQLHDADLRALGILGHGQALIATGQVAQGTARLDEVMVSVTGGELGPITSGIVYRSDPRVHAAFRPPTGVGVDRGAQCLVRRPARPGAVPRPVPRAPLTAAGGER